MNDERGDMDDTREGTDGRKRGGWTPERRAKFLATLKAKGRKVRAGKMHAGGGTNSAVPAMLPPLTARPVRTGVMDSVAMLEAAIAKRQSEIRILEQAQEILRAC